MSSVWQCEDSDLTSSSQSCCDSIQQRHRRLFPHCCHFVAFFCRCFLRWNPTLCVCFRWARGPSRPGVGLLFLSARRAESRLRQLLQRRLYSLLGFRQQGSHKGTCSSSGECRLSCFLGHCNRNNVFLQHVGAPCRLQSVLHQQQRMSSSQFSHFWRWSSLSLPVRFFIRDAAGRCCLRFHAHFREKVNRAARHTRYRFVQPASNWKPLLYSNSGTSSRGFSKQLSRSGRALLIYFPLFASNDALGV